MADEDSESTKIAWPDVPRLCFGVGGSPGDMDASIQVGTEVYVEGYRRAAESFFQYVAVHQRMNPDYVVFPLAFLWRHHIELALKSIIALGEDIAGDQCSLPFHHRLKELWEDAKPHIVVHGSPDSPELAVVEANIAEFERIDPWATGFRYPLDRNGVARGLVGPPDTVSVRKLHEAMVAIRSGSSVLS